MKIIADAHIPFLKGIAEQYGETVYLEGKNFSREKIKDADALIVRTIVKLNREILSETNVKLICSATIGYDHIDTHYCETHGIRWSNAPGCNSGSVQQYVSSALIQLSREKNFSLKGKTIGIVGVGNVGKKVARIAHLLGMKVLLNDPPRQRTEKSSEFTDLETIKREADIITFHTPLTKAGEEKTYHLADERFFDSLGRKPVIINAARGGIVDTGAIKRAIRAEKISGTIIDCWETEPDIDLDYLNLADIATPHIAGYSADGKANATRASLKTLTDFFGLNKEAIEEIIVPSPKNSEINLESYPEADRLYEALLHTYSTKEDSQLLKQKPQDFTFFREHYPLRRENPAYLIANYSSEEGEVFAKWGFRLK